MNFLAPGAWWLALLAFVPLLLLYLVRQRPRPRIVSTLLFWDALTPQLRAHPLWQRLRRWLSYLLQLLCLLLLIAVLARPAREGQSSGATATVLILDASASLQAADPDGTRTWDHLLTAARENLSFLRASDRVAIIRAGTAPEIARSWTGNRRRALEALAPLVPGDTPSDPVAALRLARELASTAAGSRIVFLTDKIWAVPPSAELLEGVTVVNLSHPGPNAGISRFDARRSYSSPGAATLTAEVVVSPHAPWRGEALLHRDGKLIDAREIDLPAGGTWTYAWTENNRASATYQLVLDKTAGHRLALDKSASLTVPALPHPVVRIVGARQPFLEAALTSLSEVDFAFVDPSALATSSPASLWIFSGVTPPENFQLSRHVLILDPPASIGFWGKTAVDAGRADTPLVTDWQRAHPLFRHVDFSSVRPGSTRIFQPSADAEIFAASFGTPILFGRWDDRSHWLVAPFDLAGGNLVFRTAFPIFLSNLLQDAPADGGIASAPLPGPVVSRLASAKTAGSDSTTTPVTASPARSWLPPLEPWRILVSIALLWTLIEWRLYSRRVTE
ncbi:vWA domain-containing protein [Rariglobus hedericola]|uniref:VWA domain-containing protein n=1 Tax=Rariglobus hedericola TaxID=2597822 RepID=A0A556QKJ4_9BACT|nr:BatA and WFA domain-containing protein [Rariglobus hedericola]TSJ77175.1 VWA domain-containing protein [Rariglobus hedericola]